MAFRKTLAQRLYHITRISSPSSSTQTTNPSNSVISTLRRNILNSPDSGEKGFFRRFLQKRDIVQSAAATTWPAMSSILTGDKMAKKLKEINLNRDRIRLDVLAPPHIERDPEPPEEISIEDAKKILKISQLESLKSKLRQIPRSCVSYDEFVQICGEGLSTPDQGLGFAKMLDDSGCVIVLGNVVYLRPEQVTKAIEGIIPLSIPQLNDPRRKELENMEKEKGKIDKEAEILVRRELWAGLGFLVAQTAGFMRLTFWELSWDVMEPICFYVTSVYFMAGYSFFLRTSKDPSFEGFFESRFSAKQKRLMKKKKFDVERFNELRRAIYPLTSERASSSSDTCDKNFITSLHQ